MAPIFQNVSDHDLTIDRFGLYVAPGAEFEVSDEDAESLLANLALAAAAGAPVEQPVVLEQTPAVLEQAPAVELPPVTENAVVLEQPVAAPLTFGGPITLPLPTPAAPVAEQPVDAGTAADATA